MRDTRALLIGHSQFPPVHRGELTTLQVNLGYLCNLSCVHCHVNAGPSRTELMDRDTIDTVLRFIDAKGIQTLDLTGNESAFSLFGNRSPPPRREGDRSLQSHHFA